MHADCGVCAWWADILHELVDLISIFIGISVTYKWLTRLNPNPNPNLFCLSYKHVFVLAWIAKWFIYSIISYLQLQTVTDAFRFVKSDEFFGVIGPNDPGEAAFWAPIFQRSNLLTVSQCFQLYSHCITNSPPWTLISLIPCTCTWAIWRVIVCTCMWSMWGCSYRFMYIHNPIIIH